MTLISAVSMISQSVLGAYWLEQHLFARRIQIEEWFAQIWPTYPPPFYASMDLRYAGFKLAPIDTNLFPAGFNHLHAIFDSSAIQAMQETLQTAYPDVTRILFIPENHTRNLHYFENVAKQMMLLTAAGYEVRCGSLRDDLIRPMPLLLPSGGSVLLEPIQRVQSQLKVGTFAPELILLNNDLSEGIPDLLLGLQQPILPNIQLGWSQRKKSQHFSFYHQVAESFATLVDIDPWLINAYFDTAQELNFLTQQDNQHLADKAAALFAKIQLKYDQYHITEKPFIMIKAEAGTYGMGVMQVTDPKQLLQLNRKQRTKMSVSKGHRVIDQVMLQEGVYSIETAGLPAVTAETVACTVGQYVVGAYYRTHAKRARDEILNTPGMSFEPFQDASITTNCLKDYPMLSKQFYLYSVVARLALLAAAYEVKEVSA